MNNKLIKVIILVLSACADNGSVKSQKVGQRSNVSVRPLMKRPLPDVVNWIFSQADNYILPDEAILQATINKTEVDASPSVLSGKVMSPSLL